METMRKTLLSTGYDTMAMLALSMTDLSYLNTIMESMSCPSREISLGVPSLRVEGITEKVADIISSVKKPGFTMAPEAATERLRRVINKGNTEEDLYRSVSIIKTLGWRTLKLYFMVGLPTERAEDIEAICTLSKTLAKQFKGSLNISISGFIPKPWSPFQWQGQIAPEKHTGIIKYLQANLRQREVSLKWHDPELTFLEGVFARGDSSLADVIEQAHLMGAYLDSWGDRFNKEAWDRAFQITGIDPVRYLSPRNKTEALPWDFIGMGIKKDFLAEEEARALKEELTPDCRFDACSSCGVCNQDITTIRYGETTPETIFPEPSLTEPTPYVVRLTKTGTTRFLSPRDYMEMIKRAIRRTGLRVEYTKGFSPNMKLSMSPPPSFGIASTSEYLQFSLREDSEPETILAVLNTVLPKGVEALSCEKGKIKLPQSFVYQTDRPFTLNLEPGLTITKGDKELSVDEYVVSFSDNTLTIRVKDGRTISPISLLTEFSPEGINAWEITKIETLFQSVDPGQ